MSMADYPVSFSLEINVEPTYENVRRLQTVLSRSLGLAARLTGDENLKRGIQTMQKAIVTANQLRLALAALQAARMAAGDPLAWAMAAVGVVSTIVTVSELAEDLG